MLQARLEGGPRDLTVFVHDYIKPIIREVTKEHRKIIQARMDAFVTPYILVSVAFVLAMMLMYATLYRRMLNNLDLEIKQLAVVAHAVPARNHSVSELWLRHCAGFKP